MSDPSLVTSIIYHFFVALFVDASLVLLILVNREGVISVEGRLGVH